MERINVHQQIYDNEKDCLKMYRFIKQPETYLIFRIQKRSCRNGTAE